ncbi:MAG: hypothetical protein MMC23_001786 [Stictis urceolatum]|nr:hypothetical protein [Stictis urceolata]
MDFFQDLSPTFQTLQSLYAQHLAPTLTLLLTSTPILRTLHAYTLHALSIYYTTLYPLLYPFYALLRLYARHTLLPLLQILLDDPSSFSPSDFLPLVTILAAGLMSLVALRMMVRTVVFWIRLGLRLAWWGAVLGVGAWVYQRGVEGAIKDAGWVLGLIQGLGKEGERRGGKKGWEAGERARWEREQGGRYDRW